MDPKGANTADHSATGAPGGAVNGIRFENVAARAGLTYAYPAQPRPMRNIEAFGCGCAAFDYDNDGRVDILLVASPHPFLYHNRGDGTFEDVSSKMGLDKVKGPWTGVGVGDFDSDGNLDLALTGFSRLALLRNAGDSFEDVTLRAGLDPKNRSHWGSSAAFMDLDGSGRLALIILNYVVMGPHEKQYCVLAPGVLTGCPPSAYRPQFGELWENDGHGHFRDITKRSGLDKTHGKALVVAFADVNNDGKVDFYIGNDGTFAELMINEGGLRFRNLGEATGLSSAMDGHAVAAMGADWADYDHDGLLDLTVTAFQDESFLLFHATGAGTFEHAGETVGLNGPTLKPLGFGAKWIDVENDGWPDISYANGHVYDQADRLDSFSTFRQPLMLFHNEPGPNGRQFNDIAPRLGGDFARPILGRGSATLDFDNDGRTDLLVVDYEGSPLLLHNLTVSPNHWITFDLRSRGYNKFAYGAKVTARKGDNVWVSLVSPASSYLSSSDPRVHFGLGSVTRLDSLEVRWPDGRAEKWHDVAVDRIVRVVEGGVPEEYPVPKR